MPDKLNGVMPDKSDDFLWPSKGDRLLRAAGNWRQSTRFVQHKIARQSHIWDGYMRAGATLIENCGQGGHEIYSTDLIYPILYCYRHGLELAIKWIISHYGIYANISSPGLNHHDLFKLWTVCRQIIVEVGSDGDNEALDTVERIVQDFHELDKGSFSFRYSTDKNGTTIRLPETNIDLKNIKNVMDAVNNLFVGADCQLDYNVSAASW